MTRDEKQELNESAEFLSDLMKSIYARLKYSPIAQEDVKDLAIAVFKTVADPVISVIPDEEVEEQ